MKLNPFLAAVTLLLDVFAVGGVIAYRFPPEAIAFAVFGAVLPWVMFILCRNLPKAS